MARTIQEIFDSIKAQAISLATDANNQAAIDMFNNTSKVASWKILFFAIALGIWTVEKIQDAFRLEIDDRISILKPGSPLWVEEKAKDFQYGYNLVADADYYDNTGLTQDQVDASKIVAYAAVVEQDRGIRIKVAKLVNGDLAPLAAPELAAFVEYMQRVKYAGIKLLITTGIADDLISKLRIYYNPLVIRADGGRIDGTDDQPVQKAFRNYLLNLPFNGLFVPEYMIEHLKAVDGVVIVKDDLWQARYGNLDFSNIDVEYNPDAGYLRISDVNLQLVFIPHAVI
jgi:hypothetical protein